MTDRILSILGVFRRRIVLIRAVEASAVSATVSGLASAAIMAGWTLAGRFTLAAVLLCVLPLVAGTVLAITKRLRYGLHPERFIQWFAIILLTACGFAGVTCVLTGTHVNFPKNWLFLIFPAGAILAFVVVLVRGVRLKRVAVLLDTHADLRERFSTALELIESGESGDLPFARAVRNQAIAAADKPRLDRVGFWTRTRATVGALGLTTVAVVLMLVVEPLESPSARQQRQWRNVSGQAEQALRRQLEAIKANAPSGNSALAEQIRQLEKLAGALRAVEPGDAKRWNEKVVELGEIAEALREAVRSGKVDTRTAERIERLIGSLERIAAGITRGMGSDEYAKADDGYGWRGRGVRDHVSTNVAANTAATAPYAPLTVYNPLHTPPATTATSITQPDPINVQIPYDRAWADACRRATEAMDKASVPEEYHQLIRDFFDTDK